MSKGNIKKIDFLMSQERDIENPTGRARFRYAVCSTPRCGSNLFSEFLHQSGLAGDPIEYLNSRYISGYLRSKGHNDGVSINLDDYLFEMERRRTSPNGYFGIKMHYEHVFRVFSSDLAKIRAFMERFDRIVFLRRRDKIAQAVSLYRAKVSQIWTSADTKFLSKDDPRLTREVRYDFVAISRALSDIIVQEAAWSNVLKLIGSNHYEVFYEDFLLSKNSIGSDVCRFLDLGDFAQSVQDASLLRQGSDDDPLLIKFLSDLGEYRKVD